MSLSIIIISFKSNIFLEKCLKSISNQSYAPDEIILYDNNSPISPRNIFSKESIKLRKVKRKYIQGSENIGFANAVNIAIKQATSELIILINPDTVLDRNFIKNIYSFYFDHMEEEKIILGGRSLSWRNKDILKTVVNAPDFKTLAFEFTSLKKIFPKNKFSNNFWNERLLRTKKNINVFGVSCNLMMFSKKDFLKIGKFDENYFLYLEDYDFCIRANNLNYKIYYVANAKAKHFHGGSNRNKKGKINQKAWDNSKKHFIKKWFGARGEGLSLLFAIDNMLLRIYKFLFKK
ncbi:MAG: glycosyltransferase [Candidatus Shapirobacteria bacterium]